MGFQDGQVMKDLKGYLDYTQIGRVLDYTRSKPCLRTHRNWLFLYLLSRTGRRISELLAIRVEHIDFDKGEVVWTILKKKHPLTKLKALDSVSMGYLRDYCRLHKNYIDLHEGKLFPFKRDWGRKLVFNYVTEAQIKMFGLNGQPIKPHPHHFRHSFAINYLKRINRPEALRMLQQELEHSKIDVTSQYLQFSLEDQRRIKEELFGVGNEENGYQSEQPNQHKKDTKEDTKENGTYTDGTGTPNISPGGPHPENSNDEERGPETPKGTD